uniref:phosphoribosylamine--glycine ligase n=1 Tax=Cladonia uncialis subsp. uncialis TaxID=180999 RepID=A0A1Z1C4S9_CLAUC|nr:putative phosphoribosylamine-glycine ligase [Cladonia uncialis subsp. uncialis]AUW31388.1 putative phosphoribosylamine-glycine ligase [Cladonia uncialis subsp. uncialis]
MLRVLLIGKGGREHAISWRLSKSAHVEHIYVVPGNGGTARGSTKVSNVETVMADDYPSLIKLAKDLQIGLVVAGDDKAVVEGIEGFCSEANIPCFAPTKAAATIEGSKTWAKDFMHRHGIPTAAYGNFSNYEQANSYLHTASYPVVIKASGLAAGKGVIIAESYYDADEALQDFMVRGKFGMAGASVVIEEFLDGDEASILTFSDGITTRTRHRAKTTSVSSMMTVALTLAVMERIEQDILRPTFEGLKSEGLTYTGMLFTGLMLTKSGPKVLEYNARFGDPETQSVLLLLDEDTDLAEIMVACVDQCLEQVKINIKAGFACNIVVVASGYPEHFAQGDLIKVGPLPDGVIIFHAGTRVVDERLVTAGGRVLSVAATGMTLNMAVANAYRAVESIQFAKMFYRKDIGFK